MKPPNLKKLRKRKEIPGNHLKTNKHYKPCIISDKRDNKKAPQKTTDAVRKPLSGRVCIGVVFYFFQFHLTETTTKFLGEPFPNPIFRYLCFEKTHFPHTHQKYVFKASATSPPYHHFFYNYYWNQFMKNVWQNSLSK